MTVSVIIPTYKRLNELMRSLESLQEQNHPEYEVILVDNAADNKVHGMVEAFNRAARVKARYTPEPNLGLHNARHAGARAARGDLLVFTDDDATFDPGWLQAYAEAFAQRPEMAAAGGPVRPIWEVSPPTWLLDFIGDAKMFGPLSLMEPYNEFRLGPDGFFWGVNMAIRRDVLFDVGGFNPELIGGLTVGDGESGLNRKLQERGWLVGYVPDALVYHHISAARMTLDYFCKWQGHLAGAQMYCRYHAHLPGRLRLAFDAAGAALSFAGIWVLARCIRSQANRPAISLTLRSALGAARFRYILRLIYDRDLRQTVTHRDWLNSFPQ